MLSLFGLKNENHQPTKEEEKERRAERAKRKYVKYQEGADNVNHIDNIAAHKFTKVLRGVKASDGREVKTVSGHAAYRMIERGISPKQVKEDFENADDFRLGKSKRSKNYCYLGDLISLDEHGIIVTVVDEKDRAK